MLIDNHYYNEDEIKGNKLIARKTLHKENDIDIYQAFISILSHARFHGVKEHLLYLKCYKLLNYMETYRKESPILIEFYRAIKYNDMDNWFNLRRLYKDLNTYQNKISIGA